MSSLQLASPHTSVWQVHRLQDRFRAKKIPGVELAALPGDGSERSPRAAIPLGTPYLISPSFEYDVQLNQFFYSAEMVGGSMATRLAYARDLKGFLDFLTTGREGRDWRVAAEEDHLAYRVWRREDPLGPRVGASTWDREVSGVDRFYRWQISQGRIDVGPIPHRSRRSAPSGYQTHLRAETAATYSHSSRRERIAWLPSKSFRTWRDVGLRGYAPNGLPDLNFRGRWADRNALFANLMVRTGMRLAEQSSLLRQEIPEPRGDHGYHRFLLQGAVAKGGSSRWIYIPSSILRDMKTYMDVDRRTSVGRAQARGVYDSGSAGFMQLVDDHQVRFVGSRLTKRREQLNAYERSRLLVNGEGGLEPAALWLTEDGLPMSSSTWQDIFRQANARCLAHAVDLHAHAHMLRHTFAVLTLEQLQRGHIAALADLNPDQRTHYTRIFGDPLDWVRRRLGHKSVTTTQIYLHALEELEMETRMALVSEHWEDSRDSRLTINTANEAPQ